MTTGNDDKTSRRSVLRAGVTGLAAVGAVGAGITVAGQGQARAQTKLAQKLVQYVEVSKKPNQHCANCSQFVAPNACKIVQGEIAATGWCVSWAPAPKS